MATAELLPAVDTRLIAIVVEPFYELVDGERKEIPPMSAREAILASVLCGHLFAFIQPRLLGLVAVEALFELGSGGRQRQPDLAYVSKSRWPLNLGFPSTAAWHVIPNLAAEFISPSNTMNEVLEKIRDYFRAGVELVWIFLPQVRQVHVYESLKNIRVRDESDELDGGAVLPGFKLNLGEFFGRE